MNKQFKLAHDGMMLAAKGLSMASEAWQYAQNELSEDEFSEFKDLVGDVINDALSSVGTSWDEAAGQFIAAAENIEAAYKESNQVITVYTMHLNGVDVELYWTGHAPSEGKPPWSTDISDVGIHTGGMFDLGNGYEDRPWSQYKDKVVKKPDVFHQVVEPEDVAAVCRPATYTVHPNDVVEEVVKEVTAPKPMYAEDGFVLGDEVTVDGCEGTYTIFTLGPGPKYGLTSTPPSVHSTHLTDVAHHRIRSAGETKPRFLQKGTAVVLHKAPWDRLPPNARPTGTICGGPIGTDSPSYPIEFANSAIDPRTVAREDFTVIKLPSNN